MGRLRVALTPLGLVDAAIVLSVIYVTVTSLHPALLVSSSLITGGDTGSHLALPAYLRSTGNPLNVTPWYPGWLDGIPAYTYYFILPDVLAALASYVVGFAVAFKLATVLGSVLMPVGAYVMGRLFRAPRPIPAALALATLPFLFDASFTIDGGNLFSTMAGEYPFSLSLSLALVSVGLFARGVRTGHGYWLAALALSATLAAHVLPWLFAVAAVGVLVVVELFLRGGGEDPDGLSDAPRVFSRPFRFALGAGLLSFGLSAWWLLPFATTQSLSDSLGYVNDNVSSLHAIFTTLGWFNATGGAGGDRWVIVLAAWAVVVAVVVRDRLGVVLSVLVVLSGLAFVYDPQSAIWNERLIPFWYITIHLAAGWLVGYAGWRWATRAPRRTVAVETQSDTVTADAVAPTILAASGAALTRAPRGTVATPDDARTYRRTLRATAAVALVGLASTVPGLITPLATDLHLSTTGNQVTSWAQWNYSGYQAKPAWPEYHGLMLTMARVARRYGCGRAMWEYSANENRFGTPEALMLMPYWTHNCVDSMEGLLMESSPTTPYHYLDQSELSVAPSDPQVGLNYGPLDVALGVRHLQILGVKYYVAFSPQVVAQAAADPELRLVATTRRWPAPGVQWRIYLIAHSPIVQPLTRTPNVVARIASQSQWLAANQSWWLHPSLEGVYAASTGPPSWPRAARVNAMSRSAPLASVRVTRVRVNLQSISFRVSRSGVPILVKISYYPRWRATGARGPYRVSPNLMVVIPTSTRVTLYYGATPATTVGNLLSAATVLAGGASVVVVLRRRRRILRR